MKSKYTKIFMIFAVVFAMVAALFVSPKAAYAEDAETVEYDLQAIIDATPSEAVISFPVVHESVYGNEIDWAVEEADKDIISYDEDAHWMVVNRLENADQYATVYLYINEQLAHTFEIKVPKGITFIPTYEIKYDIIEKIPYLFGGGNEEEKSYKRYSLDNFNFCFVVCSVLGASRDP